MKTSTIARQAAKHRANSKEPFGCCWVLREHGLNYEGQRLFSAYFRPRNAEAYWWSLNQEGDDARVIALLLFAEICEDMGD